MKRLARKAAQSGIALCSRLFGFDPYPAIKARWERKAFESARPDAPLEGDGVNLFFETESLSSISKTGRDFAFKLEKTGIPFSVVDTTAPWAERKTVAGPELDRIRRLRRDVAPYRKCIVFGGEKQRPPAGYSVYHELFYEFARGVTVWKPDLFRKAKAFCVFSGFCETLLRDAGPAGFPIAKIRYPYLFQEDGNAAPKADVRSRYGIPPDAFAVFFNFSYGSSIERKNPGAVIEAFASTFGNDPSVRLVLKTSSAEKWPDDAASVAESLRRHGIAERSVLVDANLPMEEVLDLTSAMDAYVSLHRGEGLGLGMLEAMSLGVPVVASAYGGNMDFTNDETAFLVPCESVPCPPECLFHKFTHEWAEPDVATAARHLRTIRDNPALARKKAETGLAFVRDFYSLENFEKDVRAFLARPD